MPAWATFPPPGNFFKIVNLTAGAYNKAKETISSIAAGVAGLFSQKPNDELAMALEALNAINSENISNPATSEVFPSQSSSSTTEVSSLSSSSQDKPASSPDKFKQAEESLQDLQKQLFVLQVAQTSRLNLDGAPAVEETPMSRRDLDIDADQPKFIAAIYPGFGGGGTGAVSSSASLPAEEAGSSSSASSASSSSEEASSSSSSSSSSAPDTTPPTISSFSISQCQNSLSSDGCLIATTTLNIAWNSLSSDLDYFIINNNGAVSATTATSTVVIVSDNAVFSFAVSAKDLAGNFSATSTQTAEVSTMPVVINEVAWAGNNAAYSADEWIELYNRTGKSINLANWIFVFRY